MINGTIFRLSCSRHQVSSSRPDISGISQSQRIRSTGWRVSICRALRPLTASSIWMPGKWSRKPFFTKSRIKVASSTTSTLTLLIGHSCSDGLKHSHGYWPKANRNAPYVAIRCILAMEGSTGSALTPPATADSVAFLGALHFFLHAGQADVFHVGAAYQVDHQFGDIARVVANALQRTQGPDDVEHAGDRARVFHHVGDQLTQRGLVFAVDGLVVLR